MSYKRYISQDDWVDAIMGLVENLDEDGKQELCNRMENELYYREPTRDELEEKIEELESKLADIETEKLDLEENISRLELQLQEGEMCV